VALIPRGAVLVDGAQIVQVLILLLCLTAVCVCVYELPELMLNEKAFGVGLYAKSEPQALSTVGP
jgi:hypothetical protein